MVYVIDWLNAKGEYANDDEDVERLVQRRVSSPRYGIWGTMEFDGGEIDMVGVGGIEIKTQGNTVATVCRVS